MNKINRLICYSFMITMLLIPTAMLTSTMTVKAATTNNAFLGLSGYPTRHNTGTKHNQHNERKQLKHLQNELQPNMVQRSTPIPPTIRPILPRPQQLHDNRRPKSPLSANRIKRLSSTQQLEPGKKQHLRNPTNMAKQPTRRSRTHQRIRLKRLLQSHATISQRHQISRLYKPNRSRQMEPTMDRHK